MLCYPFLIFCTGKKKRQMLFFFFFQLYLCIFFKCCLFSVWGLWMETSILHFEFIFHPYASHPSKHINKIRHLKIVNIDSAPVEFL